MKRVTTLIVLAGAAALVACASQAPAPSTASANGFTPPSGYTAKVVNGQQVYCREDAILGSRVATHEVCLTQQQLASGDTGEDSYERLQNGQGSPAGGGNPVGNTETGGR